MLNGFTYAMRTLSALPVPGSEPTNTSDSLPWFPLSGAILGGLCYVLGYALHTFGNWPEATGALVLIFSVLITRGFHLDGLADCADGFGAGWTPERRLAIMKDSHLGAFGVLALVLILLIKWVALTKLAASGLLFYIVTAYIVSRTTSAELSVCLPYARPEGGTAGACVSGAKPHHRVWFLSCAILLCLLLAGITGIVLLACGWGISRLLGIWFMRRVGGVTGDLLGTNSEIVETSLLLLCGFASSWLHL